MIMFGRIASSFSKDPLQFVFGTRLFYFFNCDDTTSFSMLNSLLQKIEQRLFNERF